MSGVGHIIGEIVPSRGSHSCTDDGSETNRKEQKIAAP